MSFSNAPDAQTLGRVAGALAVDEAFVEKDWFVVQAIAALIELGTEAITPVLSGGTSLLKGHGMIRQFSEDIDFKLSLSPAFLAQTGNKQKNVLSDFKKALLARWAGAGFTITDVIARDSNGFIQIEMDYPSTVEAHDALRPHILAELSAKPPRRPALNRPLTSFVHQYRKAAPEGAAIGCVDAVETAADKLSAFAWRSIVRDRASERDDPAIVRHLHNLAALKATVTESVASPNSCAKHLKRTGSAAVRQPRFSRRRSAWQRRARSSRRTHSTLANMCVSSRGWRLRAKAKSRHSKPPATRWHAFAPFWSSGDYLS